MFFLSHRLVCHLLVLIHLLVSPSLFRESHTHLKLFDIEMFTHCPRSCSPLVYKCWRSGANSRLFIESVNKKLSSISCRISTIQMTPTLNLGSQNGICQKCRGRSHQKRSNVTTIVQHNSRKENRKKKKPLLLSLVNSR